MSDTMPARSRPAFARLAIGWVVVWAAASVASAYDNPIAEYRADGLRVRFDGRWVGCHHGGYWPIRCVLTNKGAERVVTVEVRVGDGASRQVTRRSVRLEPESERRMTVSVPMVGVVWNGELRLLENGRPLKNGTRYLNVPQVSDFPPAATALIVSAKPIDTSAFEEASADAAQGATSAGRYYNTLSPGESAQTVAPGRLPDTWLDYSGIDVVSVDLATWQSLPAATREAVTTWVETGGTLFLTEASLDVTEIFAAVGRPPAGESVPATDSKNVPKTMTTEEFAKFVAERKAKGQQVDESGQNASGYSDIARTPWKPTGINAGEPTIRKLLVAELLLGRVIVAAGDPWPGSVEDWRFFLGRASDRLKRDSPTWPLRHGFSTRVGTEEFLDFLIPGIRSVPVVTIGLLMTGFAIVVGPVAYLYFARRKQLAMLTLAVPAVSLATVLLLLSFATLQHGFGVRTRLRSMTAVDQRTGRAVTVTRQAVFAGSVPRGGLAYDRDTAVYPLTLPDVEVSGTTDQTDRQVWAGSWLPPRTRTQFVTVTPRAERQRLTVEGPAEGGLAVVNGTSWGFRHLMLTDDDGRNFFGTDIDAGDRAVLSPADADSPPTFFAYDRERVPSQPETTGSRGFREMAEFFGGGSYRRYLVDQYGSGIAVSPDDALAERVVRPWALSVRNKDEAVLFSGLGPNMFAGILRDRPTVDTGLESAREVDGYHVVTGHLGGRAAR
ncbi:MAG: hypothetical protein AAGJ97_01860 [Planctomycetota bacterium]